MRRETLQKHKFSKSKYLRNTLKNVQTAIRHHFAKEPFIHILRKHILRLFGPGPLRKHIFCNWK